MEKQKEKNNIVVKIKMNLQQFLLHSQNIKQQHIFRKLIIVLKFLVTSGFLKTKFHRVNRYPRIMYYNDTLLNDNDEMTLGKEARK